MVLQQRSTMHLQATAKRGATAGHTVAGRGAVLITSTTQRRTGAGRRGGLVTARMLVALIGALQEEGDTINAEVAAKRLGCSEGEARELLSLLADASDFEGTRRLPLLTDEDLGEARLAYSTATGRPVRLTKRESKALLLALGEVGMDVSNPLVTKLIRSIVCPAFDQAEVSALLDSSRSALSGEFRDTLATCSKALAECQDLAFSYTDAAGRRRDRRMEPERLFREEDRWYVEGFDFVRQGDRIFRLDRMADVRACTPEPNPTWAVAHESGAAADSAPVPRAFFEVIDESLLDLFSWPHTEVMHVGDRTFAVADDYGTTWLPRRLAACAGGIRLFDEELASRVRTFAEGISE
jgi:predicted DNA-binding transcriptional regulator YafY